MSELADLSNWIEARIIEETTHWLTINKPGGVIVEKSPFEANTVEVAIEKYLSNNRNNPFVGIVHRLDRVTSGVLLIAKKRSALRHLNNQFQNRMIKKSYLALVEHEPPGEFGLLTDWLYKDQKNKKAEIVKKGFKDSYKVELSYRRLGERQEGILLEIRPLTGKFHQIRAQLAHIGCPIVGDAKYGSKRSWKKRAIALHALKLIFTDPKTSQKTIAEAQPQWPFDVI